MSVLVVGALHLDVVLCAPRLPCLDETVAGTSVDYVFGGKGGNQALAAAAMGADTFFAGRCGTDAFGEMLRLRLLQSKVNTADLQTDPGPSGMSTAIVNADGEYGAVIVSAANLNIDVSAITLPADLTILSLQNEIPEMVNLALARKAKAQGAQVWLNAAPARALAPAFLDLVDLLIVNQVEAAFYKDLPSGPKILETLGKDGARLEGAHFSGYPVRVVSAHGAGDMFVGALAAEICRGMEMREALGFAQAAAALLVSTPLAARDGLDRTAVERFRVAQPNR